MNDEIKEILDILQNCKNYDDEVFLIKQHSATLLYDYITNLQKTNKNHSKKLIELGNKITNLQQELQEANDSVTWWNNRYNAVVKNCDETVKKMIALGEENERLKDNRDWWKDRFFGQQEYDDSHRITAIEYKKRIDKAIEYIENPRHEMSVLTYQNLLNILQNGSDSQ